MIDLRNDPLLLQFIVCFLLACGLIVGLAALCSISQSLGTLVKLCIPPEEKKRSCNTCYWLKNAPRSNAEGCYIWCENFSQWKDKDEQSNP